VVHVVVANDGRKILETTAVAVYVFLSRTFAEVVIDVQRFGIVGKALVYPHVGQIFCRDVVAEPLVPRFMYDDEIPLAAPSGSRPVAAQVAVLVFVAIGNGA